MGVREGWMEWGGKCELEMPSAFLGVEVGNILLFKVKSAQGMPGHLRKTNPELQATLHF